MSITECLYFGQGVGGYLKLGSLRSHLRHGCRYLFSDGATSCSIVYALVYRRCRAVSAGAVESLFGLDGIAFAHLDCKERMCSFFSMLQECAVGEPGDVHIVLHVAGCMQDNVAHALSVAENEYLSALFQCVRQWGEKNSAPIHFPDGAGYRVGQVPVLSPTRFALCLRSLEVSTNRCLRCNLDDVHHVRILGDQALMHGILSDELCVMKESDCQSHRQPKGHVASAVCEGCTILALPRIGEVINRSARARLVLPWYASHADTPDEELSQYSTTPNDEPPEFYRTMRLAGVRAQWILEAVVRHAATR